LFENWQRRRYGAQIEQENLMARIDLPMSRVELRTDESGHDLALDIAHLTLVELLLLKFYADRVFGRAFRYDVEDIARARRNESAAAMYGLRAEIENPFTGKPIQMRDFLGWTLEQVRPLAQALDWWARLEPLVEMHRGAPNTAEKMRALVREAIGDQTIVPAEVLIALAEEREEKVRMEVERIVAAAQPNSKLAALIEQAGREAHRLPAAPIGFHPARPVMVEVSYPDSSKLSPWQSS
jgi:gamma-glutamyl:cysteine ligase YbdK (ATP-grasp superfamily)